MCSWGIGGTQITILIISQNLELWKGKKDETIADLSKHFNKMYGRIPTKINPSKTSAKLTYSNSFDHKFSLHLRERRSVTLLNMQEVALEVESNVLASNRLKEHLDH